MEGYKLEYNGKYILTCADGSKAKLDINIKPLELFDKLSRENNKITDDKELGKELLWFVVQNIKHDNNINLFKLLVRELIDTNKIDGSEEDLNKKLELEPDQIKFYKKYYAGLIEQFSKRRNISKCQKELADYLYENMNIVKHKTTEDLYMIVGNGYEPIDANDIREKYIKPVFGKNEVSSLDLDRAIDFIDTFIEPEYNIVRFSNCLYDMNDHTKIESDEPVFTLINCPYKYNPHAKPVYIKDFLYSSLDRGESTKEYIEGVFEYIGYLFTSGNSRNVLGWLTGIGGSGKSTFGNILNGLFDGATTEVDFADASKNRFATADLIGKHLNIVRETDVRNGVNEKIYKQMAGNEPIMVERKGQDRIMIPPREVPKSLQIANNPPKQLIMNATTSLLQRMLFVEFRHSFRNTDEMIKDLDELIIDTEEDMEWLIYNSLEAYRKLEVEERDFKLRLSEDETLGLMTKHAEPISYCVSELLLKYDDGCDEDEPQGREVSAYETSNFVVISELQEVIKNFAKAEGIDLPLNKKGMIHPPSLHKAIVDELDLYDTYFLNRNGGVEKFHAISKKINGKNNKVYPFILVSEKYSKYKV